MLKFEFSRRLSLLIGVVAAMTLATGPASADFRGGGAIFDFTEICEAHGWPVGSAVPARIRYAPSEDNPDGAPPSEVSIAFPIGTENIAFWGALIPSPDFNRAAGRQVYTFLSVYQLRPMLRTAQRVVTTRINPSGPATVQNARELVLRLRIRNFNNLPGCVVTVMATMRRVN